MPKRINHAAIVVALGFAIAWLTNSIVISSTVQFLYLIAIFED